jgi:hypothetical protein
MVNDQVCRKLEALRNEDDGDRSPKAKAVTSYRTPKRGTPERGPAPYRISRQEFFFSATLEIPRYMNDY